MGPDVPGDRYRWTAPLVAKLIYDIVNRIFENAGNFGQSGVQVTAAHEVVRTWRLTAA